MGGWVDGWLDRRSSPYPHTLIPLTLSPSYPATLIPCHPHTLNTLPPSHSPPPRLTPNPLQSGRSPLP